MLWFSVIYQQESAIGIPMSPPFLDLHPISLPTPPLSQPQNPCLSSLSDTANSRWLSILYMVLQMSMLLSPYISLLPPLLPSCP